MGRGIDVYQALGELIFEAFLQDGSTPIAKVTSGTASLRLYERQNADGSLKSYDFSDNTFKSTALTTETASMTHRTGNNGTTNTGVWTYRLSTLTGFTVGNVYYMSVNHSSAVPPDQVRKFQYGAFEGDGEWIVRAGVCQAGSTLSNVFLDANAPSVNDVYRDYLLALKIGTNEWQVQPIRQYNGSTKACVVDGFNPDIGPPGSTDLFRVLYYPHLLTSDDMWVTPPVRTLTAGDNIVTSGQILAVDEAGQVVIGVNNDKVGYSMSGALTTLDALSGKLTRLLSLLTRKDTAATVDLATELASINQDYGSGAGAFSNATDSQEALKDTGIGTTVQGYAAGQDPATYILTTPGQKLRTDAGGRVELAAAGLAQVQIISGITPSPNLVDSNGIQLAVLSAGQILAILGAMLGGEVLNNNTNNPTVQHVGQSGTTAITWTVGADGGRAGFSIMVPAGI